MMTPRQESSDNDDVRNWQLGIDDMLARMDERLRVIERLVWVAVGGTLVIGAIVSIGLRVVEKQGDKLDDVSLRQASTIAERKMNEEMARRRDVEMQAQIDRMRIGDRR